MYKIIGADGREYGPVSGEQLRQYLQEGRVNAQTPVLAEGGADWKRLGALPEFSPWLGVGQAPPTIHAPASQPRTAAAQQVNPFALTGMILGLVSVTFGMCCCYGIPFNILGIVSSLIGLTQIRDKPEAFTGKGMAIAGLVLSILSIILVVMFVILGVALSWHDIMHDSRRS